MNETRIYSDAFETTFANPKELFEFPGERASNADWKEILEDTEKNTPLALKVRGEIYPVRDCAII